MRSKLQDSSEIRANSIENERNRESECESVRSIRSFARLSRERGEGTYTTVGGGVDDESDLSLELLRNRQVNYYDGDGRAEGTYGKVVSSLGRLSFELEERSRHDSCAASPCQFGFRRTIARSSIGLSAEGGKGDVRDVVVTERVERKDMKSGRRFQFPVGSDSHFARLFGALVDAYAARRAGEAG